MPQKRYVQVGTGSRAEMYITALTTTYRDSAELVALCDLSQVRMNWYNQQIEKATGKALPTYLASDFDRMIAEIKPDTVIVTTMDSTHHIYIIRAMELGCDVITEKPMTIDAEKLRAIFEAVERTGRKLRVTFNYRYAPAYTALRDQIIKGVIGKPLAVDFSWLLDTSHGADYFRRWHREKKNNGGLLVHKATHHFDLVNWWIDPYPQNVFAMGKTAFYGKENAEARGEHYSYTRYTGVPEAKNDPFALFLDDKAVFRGLYLEAEAETGYLRDRNVFGEPITSEDTMAVTASYRNGVIMSYCLIAYSPWEGLRIAITGTKGRVELDVSENVNHLLGDASAAGSTGAFKGAQLRVYPMFGTPYEAEIPEGDGDHGGADPVMLEQIFSPNPPPDPYHRAATHIDGAASILTGIAANESIRTGQMIRVDDLFVLPEKSAMTPMMLTNRYFEPENAPIARELYERVKDLPLICPHGHVDPRLLADPNYQFGTPVDLLIIPDHYIFRMLYAQGISLEALGIPRLDKGKVEGDHRKIWQTVCDHWHLFRGTPTGVWLRDELRDVFGIETKINGANASEIYDALTDRLAQPEFRPRAMFERFNIEVLATTDAATDTLGYHQAIRRENFKANHLAGLDPEKDGVVYEQAVVDPGWNGRVIPTFRPDGVVNLDMEGWCENIDRLSQASGIDVTSYPEFIAALQERRAVFKEMGAKATDHAAQTAYTEVLSASHSDAIFRRALRGEATVEDAQRFTGHMLIEMARMSSEDGLVMQLHVGSLRDHNPAIYADFGRNMGADIPLAAEFTRNLKPLLDLFGNRADLTIVLFNLDETTYSRELAPLAGHYPALRLGPPWWFYDSFNGMQRFFDNVVETAGIYNTAGFNDDTRAYPSIPARHDLWRRASADWLAGLVARQFIDMDDAHEMAKALAYDLAKQTYRL